MAKRLHIPIEVLNSVSEHIQSAVDSAVEGFWSANEDEDTVTGHLGACLKTQVHTVDVREEQIPGPWKWSIDYTKFRGRGKGATESFIGADGIFELTVSFPSRTDKKCLLFQSKVDWDNDSSLVKQAILLSTWREASIFINYTPSAFEAFSVDSVLASKGLRRQAKNILDLKDALVDHFLKCKIGDTDLSYDAKRRRLIWRSLSGVVVATQFSIPSRLRLLIEAPNRSEEPSYDKLIPANEIPLYRMDTDSQGILSQPFAETEFDARRAKQVLSMAYHPDRYPGIDALLEEILKRRMQEINGALDAISTPIRSGNRR